MNEKAMEGGMMWVIVGMMLGLLALIVIGYTFFGPGQLFSKSSKPIGDTATGLSLDHDNDGVFDTIDPCPCNANQEKDSEGKCPTPSDICRKEIEEKRKSSK